MLCAAYEAPDAGLAVDICRVKLDREEVDALGALGLEAGVGRAGYADQGAAHRTQYAFEKTSKHESVTSAQAIPNIPRSPEALLTRGGAHGCPASIRGAGSVS